MKANPHSLQKILSEKQQWVVPVYQRHYEWETGEDKQIANLWNDLTDKAEEVLDPSRTLYPHYFGAVICSEPEVAQFGTTPQRFLIDGQQRITTFNILLAAIREVARERELSSIETALKSYLFNEQNESMLEPEREQFKLWPSSYDRDLFKLIVTQDQEGIKAARPAFFYKNGKLIKGQAPNLLKAYNDLLERTRSFLDEKAEVEIPAQRAISGLIEGFLSGFQLVLIELDDRDDAQEIFASLNGLAKPLAPFDLIRNDVFLRSKKLEEDSEALFEGRWKTFEAPFWTTHVRQGRLKRARADHLIAHSVVAETGREVSVAKIASEYQRYAREAKFESVASELDCLLVHAATYRQLEERPDGALTNRLATVLECWDSAVFHPLVMWINSKVGSDEHRSRLFKLVESYIIRREICGLTPKNYNKVVTSWIRAIRLAEEPVAAFEQQLGSGEGDISRCPTDSELREAFLTQPAYDRIGSRRLRYILSHIENAMRTNLDEVRLVSGDLTVEHIMPKKWAANWPLPNGEISPSEDSWMLQYQEPPVTDEIKALVRARAGLIDTFGNLTLLTRNANPKLGNKGWAEKRSLFSQSLLALNRNVGRADDWAEEEIRTRGKMLADVAAKVWSVD